MELESANSRSVRLASPREVETQEGATKVGPRRAMLSSFMGGVLFASAGFAVLSSRSAPQTASPAPVLHASRYNHRTQFNLTFGPTRAEEVLGELTRDEVKAVAEWFVATTGAAAIRNASPDAVWLSGPSAVELLRPAKAEALAYLDGSGPKPARYARVTTVAPAGVQEYKVGPIVDSRPSADATAEPLFALGDIPHTKRPTENHADSELIEPLVDETIRTLEPLLTAVCGQSFEQLEGFDPSAGTVGWFSRNDALAPAGSRMTIAVFTWTPPAPQRQEAAWLHPVPFEMKLNTTSPNPKEWVVSEVALCGRPPWSSAQLLLDAYKAGDVRTCPFNKVTGSWDVPQQTTAASPAGLHPQETSHGVAWGPWNFTLAQRPSTGLALLDVKFRGERILYELSQQDAQAAYSGDGQSQFFYSDAAWSLSMLSANLEPGVDCPEGAHFISAPNWFHMLSGGDAITDPTHPRESFFPTCVFEWDEDHTLWRHMQNSDPPEVRGYARRTIVVRSIATVANYDYITDVKFREDGEIEVFTRFAGYIEARYYDHNSNPRESNFSTIIRPDLAGPVHSHTVAWKADFDIAGVRENAFSVTKVKAGKFDTPGAEPMVSKYIEKHYVPKEGVGASTFVANPKAPGVWSVVDRSAVSPSGNARGYAVMLQSFATTQILPDEHPFVKMMPYTKYHVAVTKYHDEEYRVTNPYVQFDSSNKIEHAQDLDRFLSDEEQLLDEDLVAWISVGKEHIVRQEDMPLVSNFGAGFNLMPWNFFQQNVGASPPWSAAHSEI